MLDNTFEQQTDAERGARARALQLPMAALGPVIEVQFPTAAVARDLPHGLDRVPDGYLVVLESGGCVKAVNVSRWSDTIAWMDATANNTWARICFYTLKEGVLRHVVP